jgi:hypothetical protein
MIELFFFLLGLVNSVFLIIIFSLRKRRLSIVKKYNFIYLLLAIPAVILLIFSARESSAIQYTIFLIIFIAFLIYEWILDFCLKKDFRENMKGNLLWVIPYLMLYYSMNYGFIIMPWINSAIWGIIMAFLFVVQISLNIISHPKHKN